MSNIHNHQGTAEQQAVTVIFRVARRLATRGLKETELSAVILLRAALQLLKDKFDPSGLAEHDIEAHLIDAARLLLRKETEKACPRKETENAACRRASYRSAWEGLLLI